MGCFSCFDSREDEKPNLHNERDHPNESLPTAPSNISRLSSGGDRLKSRSNLGSRKESSSPKGLPDVNIAAHIFSFRELATATKNFRPESFLGEGGFGRVYKGRLESTGQAIAVKQLDRNGLQGNREFLVEVLMLSLLHHTNLVNLIGYCADGDQRLLVYEFMPLGSLEDHLHGTHSLNISIMFIGFIISFFSFCLLKFYGVQVVIVKLFETSEVAVMLKVCILAAKKSSMLHIEK
ncbi:hypothetical protein CsSME_00036650 [Camellia sinensis var. sinensis]